MTILYAKCENGHFFDANMDEKCPKCGSNVYTLLGDKKQKKNGNKEEAKKKKEEEKLRKLTSKKEKGRGKNKTVEPVITEPMSVESVEEYISFPEQAFSSVISNEPASTNGHIGNADIRPAVVKLHEDTGIVQENEDIKTIRFWHKEDTCIEPVVGWLVCVKGAEKGKCYTLKTGANRVGRLESVNDVVLARDEQVSRREHIVLTFEPKHCKFYLQPGAERSLAYLNGALLCDNVVLSERDRIELGGSTLVFVPLCGEGFDWNIITGA